MLSQRPLIAQICQEAIDAAMFVVVLRRGHDGQGVGAMEGLVWGSGPRRP
jgi:hypothetical protein